MLDANVNEDFKLDPIFNDARCDGLFNPSTLNVNLKLSHECGTDEVTNIGVKSTTQNPSSLFKHTEAAGVHLI